MGGCLASASAMPILGMVPFEKKFAHSRFSLVATIPLNAQRGTFAQPTLRHSCPSAPAHAHREKPNISSRRTSSNRFSGTAWRHVCATRKVSLVLTNLVSVSPTTFLKIIKIKEVEPASCQGSTSGTQMRLSMLVSARGSSLLRGRRQVKRKLFNRRSKHRCHREHACCRQSVGKQTSSPNVPTTVHLSRGGAQAGFAWCLVFHRCSPARSMSHF